MQKGYSVATNDDCPMLSWEVEGWGRGRNVYGVSELHASSVASTTCEAFLAGSRQ